MFCYRRDLFTIHCFFDSTVALWRNCSWKYRWISLLSYRLLWFNEIFFQWFILGVCFCSSTPYLRLLQPCSCIFYQKVLNFWCPKGKMRKLWKFSKGYSVWTVDNLKKTTLWVHFKYVVFRTKISVSFSDTRTDRRIQKGRKVILSFWWL